MTADVQRELAEVLDDTATGLWMGQHGPGWGHVVAAALLPVVERAEKRAAARALREAAATAPLVRFDNGYPVRAVPVSDLLSFAAALTPAALDPSGAAEGAGR